MTLRTRRILIVSFAVLALVQIGLVIGTVRHEKAQAPAAQAQPATSPAK